ncbi:hypothetical protein FQZ97_1099240 [compost metagenome]
MPVTAQTTRKVPKPGRETSVARSVPATTQMHSAPTPAATPSQLAHTVELTSGCLASHRALSKPKAVHDSMASTA